MKPVDAGTSVSKETQAQQLPEKIEVKFLADSMGKSSYS